MNHQARYWWATPSVVQNVFEYLKPRHYKKLEGLHPSWKSIVARLDAALIKESEKKDQISPYGKTAGSKTPPPPRAKCIAVDLDNTLWPGVLVEHRPGQYTADNPYPVEHIELQKALLVLHSRGVLLITCSRNDRDAVLAAWPPVELCPLQPDHFVCHRIDWTPKSKRLLDYAAATELNKKCLWFIDDMPPERAEVEAGIPECRVLGEDLFAAAVALRQEATEAEAESGSSTTADAMLRTERTRAMLARAEAAATFSSVDDAVGKTGRSKGADKARRRAAKDAGAKERVPGTGGGYATVGGYPDAFLETLNLTLTFAQRGPAELRRAAELAARTTQYNTAIPKPEKEALAEMKAALEAGGQVWEMSAEDRFGDHGVVGVIVLTPMNKDTNCYWSVDLVSISCRVLAMEPGHVFLAEVLRHSGASCPIEAELAITERNSPCRLLFSQCGFTQKVLTYPPLKRDSEEGGEFDPNDANLAVERWCLGSLDPLPVIDRTVYSVRVEKGSKN